MRPGDAKRRITNLYGTTVMLTRPDGDYDQCLWSDVVLADKDSDSSGKPSMTSPTVYLTIN